MDKQIYKDMKDGESYDYQWEQNEEAVQQLKKEGWEMVYVRNGSTWSNHLLRMKSDDK